MNEPRWMLDEAARFDRQRRRSRLRQYNWGFIAAIAFPLIVWGIGAVWAVLS